VFVFLKTCHLFFEIQFIYLEIRPCQKSVTVRCKATRAHAQIGGLCEYLRPPKEGTRTPTALLGQERCKTRLLALFRDV
jgi:hypothetical protein